MKISCEDAKSPLLEHAVHVSTPSVQQPLVPAARPAARSEGLPFSRSAFDLEDATRCRSMSSVGGGIFDSLMSLCSRRSPARKPTGAQPLPSEPPKPLSEAERKAVARKSLRRACTIAELEEAITEAEVEGVESDDVALWRSRCAQAKEALPLVQALAAANARLEEEDGASMRIRAAQAIGSWVDFNPERQCASALAGGAMELLALLGGDFQLQRRAGNPEKEAAARALWVLCNGSLEAGAIAKRAGAGPLLRRILREECDDEVEHYVNLAFQCIFHPEEGVTDGPDCLDNNNIGY